jgi:mannose-6-phosphate isomerase-like protein (cupin superfamily)
MTLGGAAEYELVNVGQLGIQYLIDGTAMGGMGVFELTVPPNAQVPPPHSHTRNEECIYVLEGMLRCSVDGMARDLAQGEWGFTPRGSVHHFSNPYSETARALIVLTPDIGVQYFRDVGAIVNAGGPPDHEKLIGVMSRYGLVPASPPQSPAPGMDR